MFSLETLDVILCLETVIIHHSGDSHFKDNVRKFGLETLVVIPSVNENVKGHSKASLETFGNVSLSFKVIINFSETRFRDAGLCLA